MAAAATRVPLALFGQAHGLMHFIRGLLARLPTRAAGGLRATRGCARKSTAFGKAGAL